jgi:hypothetical protein
MEAMGWNTGTGRAVTVCSRGIQIHQQYLLGLPGFVKAQRDGRAAVADVIESADELRLVDMAKGDIAAGGKALVGKASSAPT